MVDVFSRKASFDEVVLNREAIEFHVRRFERGNRDNLARLCYQHYMLEQTKASQK